MNGFRSIFLLTFTLVACACLFSNLHAQTIATLDEKVVSANRELDRRLLEAHELKNAAMVESLFSECFLHCSGRQPKQRSERSAEVFRSFLCWSWVPAFASKLGKDESVSAMSTITSILSFTT